MTDLRCTRCDTTATYADANIADIERSCEDERGLPAKHEWEPNG